MMEVGDIVAGRFKIVQILSQGAISLYRVRDSNHKVYILKAEECRNDWSFVEHEAFIYGGLATSPFLSPVLGIPPVFFCGTHSKNGVKYYVLVMEYLGVSLSQQMLARQGKLSLKAVLVVGIQMLRILEDIHGRGILHRNIRPDNILTGACVTDRSSLYLCDFSIAKHFSHDADSIADLDSNAVFLYGTREFASARAMDFKEQGRSDDLESLFYTLIFLKFGSLPWLDRSFPPDLEHTGAARQVYYNSVWLDLPPQMKMYWKYVKSLHVRDKPDYKYLRSILDDALICAGMRNDGGIEWSLPPLNSLHSEEEKEAEDAGKIHSPGFYRDVEEEEEEEEAEDAEKSHSPMSYAYSKEEKEAGDADKMHSPMYYPKLEEEQEAEDLNKIA